MAMRRDSGVSFAGGTPTACMARYTATRSSIPRSEAPTRKPRRSSSAKPAAASASPCTTGAGGAASASSATRSTARSPTAARMRSGRSATWQPPSTADRASASRARRRSDSATGTTGTLKRPAPSPWPMLSARWRPFTLKNSSRSGSTQPRTGSPSSSGSSSSRMRSSALRSWRERLSRTSKAWSRWVTRAAFACTSCSKSGAAAYSRVLAMRSISPASWYRCSALNRLSPPIGRSLLARKRRAAGTVLSQPFHHFTGSGVGSSAPTVVKVTQA